jgi:probable biosynthetic protein (TIGR04098 family)
VSERGTPTPFEARRDYEINMPQMALGGLSEGWLFKELGDLHWTMISSGLRTPSSQLADENGERLYVTFTRLRLSSTHPLNSFVENDRASARGSLKRFGGGVFFGEITFGDDTRRIEARLMSSFTKRSSTISNQSLLRGHPLVPDDSPVPALQELPAFAQEYRRARAADLGPNLFEREYRLSPFHDINGVGQLYFAAFPTINDHCEMDYFEDDPSWCQRASTLTRDIHYYGNCDLNDRILYRLHQRTDEPGAVTLTSSLARKSDGMVIARLITTKAIQP